eukprot:scaffold65035_cov67-Cyclotella_meneghiniana.AAC.2
MKPVPPTLRPIRQTCPPGKQKSTRLTGSCSTSNSSSSLPSNTRKNPSTTASSDASNFSPPATSSNSGPKSSKLSAAPRAQLLPSLPPPNLSTRPLRRPQTWITIAPRMREPPPTLPLPLSTKTPFKTQFASSTQPPSLRPSVHLKRLTAPPPPPHILPPLTLSSRATSSKPSVKPLEERLMASKWIAWTCSSP